MTSPTRADHLRAAEDAERLGDFALAGRLKSLALATPSTTPDAPTEDPDVDALKAQIAEAEEAGNWALAGTVKSQLLDAQRAPRK